MFKTANVTVMVQDIEKALAFYTEVLGLSAGMRHGDNYAEVKAPGVTIVLHPKGNHGPKASKAGNLSIGFQVADVKKATEQMIKKGLASSSRKMKRTHSPSSATLTEHRFI